VALLAASEFVEEIIEPYEPESQTSWREFHTAQGKENGIESWKNSKNQNEGDSWPNKYDARMAVDAFRPAFADGKSSRGIPRLVYVVVAIHF
jgi:hypothetical protein